MVLAGLAGVLVGVCACATPDQARGGRELIGGDPFGRFQAERKIEEGKFARWDEGGSTYRAAAVPGETRLLAVYDAGQDDPHTIRLDTALVDLRDHAALAESISIIANAVAPDDAEVRRWMLDAYAQAWARHRVADDNAGMSREDLIVEWMHLGLTYSAFGVPPDIGTIVVTSRDTCRPRVQIDHLYRDWHRHCR